MIFRITPAYAGKRFSCKVISRDDEDHPRLCGEKSSPACIDDTDVGSPPPMRGKAQPPEGLFPTARITPAYAGKRRAVWYL